MTAEDVIRAIANYHVNTLGWPAIAYHFFISKEGNIFQLHDLETITYNVADRNHEVVGICLEGNFTDHEPLPDQLAATKQLLSDLLGELPGREVVGHKDIAWSYSPTACPGNTWPAWREKRV